MVFEWICHKSCKQSYWITQIWFSACHQIHQWPDLLLIFMMFLAKVWTEFFSNLTLCKQGFLKGLIWDANLFRNFCVNFRWVKINVLSLRKILMPKYVFVCFKFVIFTYFLMWIFSFSTVLTDLLNISKSFTWTTTTISSSINTDWSIGFCIKPNLMRILTNFVFQTRADCLRSLNAVFNLQTWLISSK